MVKQPQRSAAADVERRIVDAALALAEDVGWENLRLRQVAERLDMPLDTLRGHFRDADAIADAWLGRALAAMLAPVEPVFWDLPARERLRLLMLRWFDAAAEHRTVTVQMLAGKLWPFHPHHWVPMVFNLSRLIQWLRDAAALDAGGVRRQVEEVGLTGLFLATLAVWSVDDTPGQERTRIFLDRRLAHADRAMARTFARGRPDAAPG